jgi:hypothetical protein
MTSSGVAALGVTVPVVTPLDWLMYKGEAKCLVYNASFFANHVFVMKRVLLALSFVLSFPALAEPPATFTQAKVVANLTKPLVRRVSCIAAATGSRWGNRTGVLTWPPAVIKHARSKTGPNVGNGSISFPPGSLATSASAGRRAGARTALRTIRSSEPWKRIFSTPIPRWARSMEIGATTSTAW